MNVRLGRDGTVWLTELSPAVRLALERLPGHAGIGSGEAGDAARARLMPDPGGDDGCRETWREVVWPVLEAASQRALRAVSRQLADALPKGDGLVIRPARRELWMHLLNRARLAIAARRGFTEEELAQPLPSQVENGRDLERFEMEVYAAVLGLLVEVESHLRFGPPEGEERGGG